MDSLSQIVLGASLAAAIAPGRHRRAALAAGAALGTLPDLDSLLLWPLGLDPVMSMTWHRGPSHSLFVLVPLAVLIWAAFRRTGGRVAEAPRRWFFAILLVLVTHALLDALTVYGTQLWWPLPVPPVMWSSLFIIDPLYTLPLLFGCVVALVRGWRPGAQRALVIGLALSTAYIGWSLLAKGMVERHAERSLVAMGLQDAPRFSVPMPLNTLLWRVVVMTPEGYLDGQWSVVADRGVMQFQAHASDIQARDEVAGFASVQRLLWFNRGFMAFQVRDNELVASDLRMGVEPDYVFNFVVAERDGPEGAWREITPRQRAWPWEASRRLAGVWSRIWSPDPPAELPPP